MKRTHKLTLNVSGKMVAMALVAIVTGFGASAYIQQTTQDTITTDNALEARFVRPTRTIPWVVISEQEVLSGATIPPDTHVVFHLPLVDFNYIHREVLLGQAGDITRYWGYCFPENYDPSARPTQSTSSFQGRLFLSELERKERAERERAELEEARRFSINNIPTQEELQKAQQRPFRIIRHQMDLFRPGHLCYIMSERPLALGLDPDNDRLNDKLEEEVGTDPAIRDTDADGLIDGTEYIGRTDPLTRDTDTDGLIDGIEDKNWNGRLDAGETDPRNRDSDRDGLCDGLCRVRLANGQEVYIGEDVNLNGILDPTESSPLSIDTDNDGILDEHELLTCILNGGNSLDCRSI